MKREMLKTNQMKLQAKYGSVGEKITEETDVVIHTSDYSTVR